jgi:hypothetical protein
MSHPEHTAVAIDLKSVMDSGKMDEFQKAMNEWAEAQNQAVTKLAQELGVSEVCAGHVMYLRGRHRWSEELEEALIYAHKRGEEVNIFEFGVTEESQMALLKYFARREELGEDHTSD